MHNKAQQLQSDRVILLAHLSHNLHDEPQINTVVELSESALPKGRVTGLQGYNFGVGAKMLVPLLSKSYANIDLHISENARNSMNPEHYIAKDRLFSIKDIDTMGALHIGLVDSELAQQLLEWSGCHRYVKEAWSSGNYLCYCVAHDPEIINLLFDAPALAHIKAIIWPSPKNNALKSVDQKNEFIQMITLRSPESIGEYHAHYFDLGAGAIQYNATKENAAHFEQLIHNQLTSIVANNKNYWLEYYGINIDELNALLGGRKSESKLILDTFLKLLPVPSGYNAYFIHTAQQLTTAVISALVELRDLGELDLSFKIISDHMTLTQVIAMALRNDLSESSLFALEDFLLHMGWHDKLNQEDLPEYLYKQFGYARSHLNDHFHGLILIDELTLLTDELNHDGQ